MSDPATQRKAACEGKDRFTSATLTRKVAQKLKGTTAYRCRFCGKWHVGRPSRK